LPTIKTLKVFVRCQAALLIVTQLG